MFNIFFLLDCMVVYKLINPAGCRAIGFNVLMSAFIGLLVNLVMSYPTLPVSGTTTSIDPRMN